MLSHSVPCSRLFLCDVVIRHPHKYPERGGAPTPPSQAGPQVPAEASGDGRGAAELSANTEPRAGVP